MTVVQQQQALLLADRTVTHILIRIREDERFRDLLGPGTQSFTLLVNAYSAIHPQEPPAKVAATVLGCSPAEINPIFIQL